MWNPSVDQVEASGGQVAWTWAIPLPYRALAAPWSGSPMPAAPRDVAEHEGKFEHQIGYYSALQSFLAYSFAWTRPDKGLAWWYSNGCPVDDDRLRLIAETWETDGTLLGYLAWLTTRTNYDTTSATLGTITEHLDRSQLDLSPALAAQLHAARREAPWTGGSDPFHLGGGDHVSAPSFGPSGIAHEGWTPENVRLVGVDVIARSATFVSNTIEGWYAALDGETSALPSLEAGRSWHIDVFVKPIGFLGTYRKSRVTGLWFSGPHRYHAIGN